MSHRLLTATLATVCAAMSMQALTVSGLHTQHLTNPVGIDETAPIFSWMLESTNRGVEQVSYQIQVATDAAMGAIAWDSGVVESSVSTGVKAEGFNPSPSTRYYWKVTVTDNKGETATSTQRAYFETGLLDSGWSGAQWIKRNEQTVSYGSGSSSTDYSTIQNYTVEADFMIERAAAGIIWGATDHSNYYMWQFNTESTPTRFRPHRWSNGNPACLDNINVELENWKSYHMKVEVSENGTVAKTYLDDVLIDTRSGSFPCGEMGMRSAKGEKTGQQKEAAYYDDLKVTAEDGTVLFQDSFENLDNFNNARLINNELYVFGDVYSWQQNFQANPDIKNYTIEGKFNIDQVAAGICFASSDDNNFYMWQFNLEGSEPRFRPHRWVNGGAACLENVTLPFALTLGMDYYFRIEVTNDGKLAKTYLNNTLIDTREGDYTYGRIGIRADHGEYNTATYERAYYDNYKITADDGTVVYSENFDAPGAITLTEGDPIDGWLRVGAYADTYSWVMDDSSYDTSLHYQIEADLTLLQDNVAIVFSRTGSSTYHMWSLNTHDNGWPCIRRHVYVNSALTYSDTQINAFSTADFLNHEHHFLIDVEGYTVTTYIDGIKVDTFKDYSGTLVYGTMGFRVYNGDVTERAYADNVKVTVFNTDGTQTVTLNEDFEGETYDFADAERVEIDGNHKIYLYSKNEQNIILERKAEGMPMFRKEFAVNGAVKSAKLYSTALGNYNVFINGQRVGNLQDDGTMAYDELMPGWTDYRKTLFYMTHDVTSLITEGTNAIGAQVSNGWWAGDISHGVYGNPKLAFMGKLVIELESGEIITVVTDDSWMTSNQGAFRYGDIYHGETYDAAALDNWTEGNYVCSDSWEQVAIDNQFQGDLRAYEGPSVRIRSELERKPAKVTIYNGVTDTGTTYGMINETKTMSAWAPTKLKQGETMVIDFGQNFAGWVRFNVKGDAGTMMHLRFAEMLNDNGDAARGDDGPGGSLYTVALRTAKCQLKYYLAGKEEGETYSPTGTFFGFRYCEVTATKDIELQSIVGQVVGSALEEGSSLTVNDSAVNQLYSNIQWGQRSNFISIPTDCPQRDERLGWTADTQIFSPAACYNSNTIEFYRKWMRDMRDSQREDGAYPSVAPYNWVGYGEAAWADAGVIVPWIVYSMYGNTDIIEENYESMEKYMDFVAQQSGSGYTYNGAGTAYGDWVAFESTDSRYVSVCYYAYTADLMSRMSKVLSKEEGDAYDQKAAQYAELFNNIKAEYQKRYTSSRTNLPTLTSQTAYLLALRFNLLKNDDAIEACRTKLRNKIVANGNKLSTGFVGTGVLNQTLSENGMDDLAYTLLLQHDCPSWLYPIDQGATTMWERWNSYTIENGFQDISMNSFNHYAYGAVGEWMYRYMAGIAPGEAGFKHFELNPTPDNRSELNGQPRITNVDATYASNVGAIHSAWTRNDDGTIELHVTVPANTTATLHFPIVDETKQILEGDALAAEAEGVEFVGISNGKAEFNLGSGSYVFKVGEISGIEAPKADKSDISVAPNPTSGPVHVDVKGADVAKINVHDLTGNCVASEDGKADVDLTACPSGIYILSAKTTNDATAVAKVVRR